jgi:hypothetical protein
MEMVYPVPPVRLVAPVVRPVTVPGSFAPSVGEMERIYLSFPPSAGFSHLKVTDVVCTFSDENFITGAGSGKKVKIILVCFTISDISYIEMGKES